MARADHDVCIDTVSRCARRQRATDARGVGTVERNVVDGNTDTVDDFRKVSSKDRVTAGSAAKR
jgi:hypothetical protein